MNGAYRKHFSAAILAGAIGGLFAAWFKLGWEVPWHPRAFGRIAEPMVLVSMYTHVPTPVWISYVIHFSFSIVAGAVFGALVEYAPIVALGNGIAFGLVIWIGAHEIVMPAIGLTPPAWKLPANEQLSEFFGHAFWGLTIGVFFNFYRQRFLKAAAPHSVHGRQSIELPVAESVAVF